MNRLANELSPYLLQHQNNPVDWYPWGDEAFQKAVSEDKPIFLSIGYSTCHWCHVMEGDSFEDQEVADYLNQHFVSVKVDREERPDVDSIYMKAILAMNQRGGWPLSAMLTPTREPFWGGTFLPKAEFLRLLQLVKKSWDHDRDKILDSSQELTQYLSQSKNNPSTSIPLNENPFKNFAKEMLDSFDPDFGGFSDAPKFPPAQSLMALMRLYRRSKHQPLADAIKRTLDAMARAGIHDHLGGGFHRYATDEEWKVPHFEKMLYDNALLIMCYTEAFQLFQSPVYREVVATTIEYLMRDLASPDGGFYSAEDADSEKTEGKFYVWTERELKSLLTEDEFHDLQKRFAIHPDGNFKIDKRVEELEEAAGLKSVKSANILHCGPDDPYPSLSDPKWKEIFEKLNTVRSERIRPHLDDKILTSWNGLTITALAKAYRVFQDERYLRAATRTAELLLSELNEETPLYRILRQGQFKYRAYLEDYAAMVMACFELYQATFQTRWLKMAMQLQSIQDQRFWDESSACYFETDGHDSTLLFRSQERIDQATPSGNNLSVLNLLRLARLSLNPDWQKKATTLMQGNWQRLERYPTAFPWQVIALDFALDEETELLISGPIEQEKLQELLREFAPHLITLVGHEDLPSLTPIAQGKVRKAGEAPRFYVCHHGYCEAPTENWDDALKACLKWKALTL